VPQEFPTFGYEFVSLFNRFTVAPPLKHLELPASYDKINAFGAEVDPILCAITYKNTYMSDIVIVAPVPTELHDSPIDGPANAVSEFLLLV
jgi:hypothetical protein